MGATLDGFPDFFQQAVNSLLAACPGSSIGSGSRTTEEQAALYNRLGAWSSNNPGAAAPGTSNHEAGVGHGAADLQGDIDCMHANAGRFGLHFPIANEPWHVEPTDELIEMGMEFFGMESTDSAAEESTGDWLERLMSGEVAANPVKAAADDVTEAPAEAAPVEGAEEFVPEASAGFESGGKVRMSAIDVAKVYAQAGFRGDALVRMVAIARGESGWIAAAQGDTSLTNGTWGPSIGLSQIRSLNSQYGTGGWRDGSRLSDPLFNARAAYAISNGGTNFTPWTVYNEGIYEQFVEEAKAAVTALGTGAVAGEGPPAASVDPIDEDGVGLETLVDATEMAQEFINPLTRFGTDDAGTVEGLEDVKAAKKREDLADA